MQSVYNKLLLEITTYMHIAVSVSGKWEEDSYVSYQLLLQF